MELTRCHPDGGQDLVTLKTLLRWRDLKTLKTVYEGVEDVFNTGSVCTGSFDDLELGGLAHFDTPSFVEFEQGLLVEGVVMVDGLTAGIGVLCHGDRGTDDGGDGSTKRQQSEGVVPNT